MSKFQNDAIFWVDVDKIDPNPYQPRREFEEDSLRNLAESIRQYGVLQPLTVTRNEETKPDGGLKVYYELIAGERRLRASKKANLSQVPVTIRSQKEDAEVKLELAIIENLQREDLNPIERAEAFDQLAEEFDFTHREIAEKIGKSREYVSNSMRLLKLPEKVKQAVISGKITEGHTRPIMMLRDKPEKQEQLFKEVVHQDLTVRESEKRARRDAQDKVRKKKNKIDPETKALEDELSDTLGTRVQIEKKEKGGKLVIDFFSDDDLEALVKLMQSEGSGEMGDMMEKYIQSMQSESEAAAEAEAEASTDDASMAETLGTVIQEARKKQQQEAADRDATAEAGDAEEAEVLSEEPADTGSAEQADTAPETVTADKSAEDTSAARKEEQLNTNSSASITDEVVGEEAVSESVADTNTTTTPTSKDSDADSAGLSSKVAASAENQGAVTAESEDEFSSPTASRQTGRTETTAEENNSTLSDSESASSTDTAEEPQREQEPTATTKPGQTPDVADTVASDDTADPHEPADDAADDDGDVDNDQSVEVDDDDNETETAAAEEEDDMYAVSNFSI